MQELDENSDKLPKQGKLTENNLKRLDKINSVIDNNNTNN